MTRYLLLVLLFAYKMSFAQSFITKVSATTIGKSDVLEIEYVAENVQMEQFVLPKFNNWTVVSGPNLSSSRMQTGNVVKQQMVYSVMVQPIATGTLSVPGATALINDKPTRSNSLSVQVKNVSHLGGSKPPSQTPQNSLFDQVPFEDELPSSQYLKKGEKAIDKIKNNILIKLEVNKRTCYVGEPILATYKLCTRLRSKSKVVKQPIFSGCTVIELTGDQQDQHVEKINGVDYNVFVIRKVELFPLSEGQLLLPETSVENRVSFYDASHLSYRDLYYGAPSIPVEEQTVTLQNKPAIIEVKALPALPAVGNTEFSGAIGKFDITVSTGGDQALTTNNTHKLLFTIQGEGNLQQVKAPFIKWPNGLEAFEATEQVEDDKNSFPVKSSKIFTFPFIADKKGNYAIPPIQFTYFDPAANKYVTKATHGFILPVEQGKKAFLNITNRSADPTGFQSRLYIILGAAVVAVLIGLVWFNGKPKPQPKPVVSTGTINTKEEIKPELKKPDASEYLFAIRELHPDNNSSQFYKQLCKNLEAYVRTKFNLEPGQLAFSIEQQHEHSKSLQQLKGLLDNCSLGMYTPAFSIEEAMQHRLEAIEVLCRLEKGVV